MQSKIQLKPPMVVVNILGIVFFFILIFFLYQIKPMAQRGVSIEQQATSTLPVSNIGLPVHLRIPSLNMDAVIESVGLTTSGVMAVPKGPTTVAWFDLGPRPGEVGSAVISGHSGWKDGVSAVFDTLRLVKVGDRISSVDADGVEIHFRVRAVASYDANADALEVFISTDGKAHLNLITCEGVWDKVAKNYSNRLVVFTDRE